MELLSRIGYVIHGAIYLFIGALAARLAWGARGQLTDPPSAIELIDTLPAANLLLSIIAAGLAAYSLWRFVQAAADPDCQGRTVKGLIVRTGRVISGIGYLALAVFAGILVGANGNAAGGESNWAYRILNEPIGSLFAALVAVILFGVATDDARKACTTQFGERLSHHEMTTPLLTATRCAGSWGFASRAILLAFGGVYLMHAVFNADPGQVKGLRGILGSFLQLPHGHWLLGFVAMGLGAYGVFMIQAGLYRRHPY